MTFKERRAVGDTLATLAFQLATEGQPIDLTGLTVKFTMVDDAGNVKVPESVANVSAPTLGYVEYDFQSADVDTAGNYRGWFLVYSGSEPETFPDDDEGIEIEIFDKQVPAPATGTITDEEFAELAKAPRRTRTVEGTVEERSIDDLIKARRQLSTQESAPWGIRVARTKPPGTCS